MPKSACCLLPRVLLEVYSPQVSGLQLIYRERAMTVGAKERKNVTIDLVKCACPDCVCVFNAKEGLESDGRIYCGSACADHHKSGNGCKHAGCVCHG